MAIGLLWTVAILIATEVASAALSTVLSSRKLKPGKVAPPEWQSGSPIPVLFGTRLVSGQAMWYGGYKTRRIKQWTLGFGTTIGFRYFVEMGLVYCWGPIRGIRDVVTDNGRRLSELGFQRELLLGSYTDNSGLYDPDGLQCIGTVTPGGYVNVSEMSGTVLSPYSDGSFNVDVWAPNLYGGNGGSGQGGLRGRLHLYKGNSGHAADTVMDPDLAANYALTGHCPTYDGLCYAILRSRAGETKGFEIGTTPTPRPFALELCRQPRHIENTAVDARVPAVIYDLMTDPRWGMGIDPALVDVDDESEDTDQILVSGLLENFENPNDVIAKLEAHDEGKVYQDPASGHYKYARIRNDYVKADLLHLTADSGLAKLEHKQGTWAETVNEVVVQFPDRARLYKTNEVRANNPVHQRAFGRTITKTLTFEWVCDEAIARRVAARELRQGSVPLGSGRAYVDRRAAFLYPGAPFRISDDDAGLSDVVMRAVAMDMGTLEDGTIVIDYKEDYFDLPAISITTSSGTAPTAPTPPEAAGEPTITPTYTENNTTGTATLDIEDLSNVIATVEYQTRTGYGSWSGWSTIGSAPYTASVTKDTYYASAIEMRVTNTDGDVIFDEIHEFQMANAGAGGPYATTEIVAVFDGGGSALATGVALDLRVPFACMITEWSLLADQSGSLVVDIWKDVLGSYPPTVADTITASAKPTLSSADHNSSSTLTGWTTSIAAGDTLRFNIDSAATVQRATLLLKVQRT